LALGASGLLLALGLVACPARAGSVRSADVDALSQAACAAGHAYAARDLEALERLTADDYVQTDVRGGVLTRAEWLTFVKNRPSTLSIECANIEVRFYGATALVTGGWTYTNHKPGGDVVTRSRWTSLWTQERGTWKRHAFRNTYVNPAADQCAMDAPR
jgi:ketosteroid isomerase-like protein